MTAPTHASFASASYLGLSVAMGYPVDAVHLLVLAVASLLPDVDYPNSWIGKVFMFLSERIERSFGHRTLTHSVAGCAILAALIFPVFFLSKQIYFLLQVGYFSHIALDMWTKTGIPFLWPFLKEHSFVFPGVKSWRIEVGKKPEVAVCVFYLLSSVFLYKFEAMGYDRILSLLIQDIAFAKKDFIKYSPTNFTTLKGEFKDNITMKIVKAEYTAVALYKDGIIVRDGSRLRLVSKNDSAHLYPNSVYIDIKEPIETFAPKLKVDGLTIGELISRVDPTKEHYIIGEAIPASKVESTPDKADSFNAIKMSNNKIEFRYATVADLEAYSSMLLGQGEVTIQYRLRNDEQVSVINANNDSERVLQIPLNFPVKDIDILKVKVGDEIENGDVIAENPDAKNQIEKKEAEMEALRADWNAEKLETKKRKSEINGELDLLYTDEELEKLKNILSKNDIRKIKEKRKQLAEEISLLEEKLKARNKAHNAKKKKLEVDLNQLKEKRYIESPVSGKVVGINFVNGTDDKTNIKILINYKDPFQRPKGVSKQGLTEKVFSKSF